MTTKSHANWIRSAYLYIVSLVAIIVFIIGTSMVANLLIKHYVFGLEYSWYQNPAEQCNFIMENNDSKTKQADFNTCVDKETARMKEQAKYEFADTMSTGIAMDLIAIPIFLFHWALIRKEREVA